MSGPELVDRGEGRFQLCGELNMRTVPDLYRASAGFVVGHPRVRVDLAEVHHTDSAGLALLIEWMREARDRNVDIAFQHLPDQLLRIARASGLADILPVTD
ncbi:MAG TPA: STAS domain-containing protein [Gammaproteobacteria bacterium]|nr:STAS domain-containing protein [Gammaproteobacteria bacterium]